MDEQQSQLEQLQLSVRGERGEGAAPLGEPGVERMEGTEGGASPSRVSQFKGIIKKSGTLHKHCYLDVN